MPHQVVGLDIGSHAVKVVQVRTGLRSAEIVLYDEEPIAPWVVAEESGEEGDTEASEDATPTGEWSAAPDAEMLPRATLAALEQLAQRGALEGDVLVVSYGLERCVQTEIGLPFADRKNIEKVLPIQIGDRFPMELSELALDFTVAATPNPSNGEHRVGVVATPKERLTEFLGGLSAAGLEPRIVDVRPARLLGAATMLGANMTGTVALVDVGYAGTDLLIVRDGDIRAMRTLRLGGAEIDARIASTFQVGPEQAEAAKQQRGSLWSDAEAPPAPDQATVRLRELCRGVGGELARDLNRAFHGYLAAGGHSIDRVYVSGGTAALTGLSDFLSAALDLPVELLTVPQAENVVRGAGARAVGALGLAARGASISPASSLNLRRGGFAFKGDFEFLRVRAKFLAVAALLLVAGFAFMTVTGRAAQRAQRDAYREALCAATEVTLGECMREPGRVMAEMTALREVQGLIPDMSAYDHFRDVSAALLYVREDEGIPLEIEQLLVDIQRDIIRVEGRTTSAASVDFVAGELDALACVYDLQIGDTSQTRGGETYEFDIGAKTLNDCRSNSN